MLAAELLTDFRPPTYASPQRLIDGHLPPTKGEVVREWMERYLVHGEGDHLGEPAIMAPHQRYILNRLYEYDPATGRLLHDRVLILMGKGNAKTELVADIGVAELVGPVAPLLSPHVVASAASYEQADNVFGAARAAIEHGPLADYFDLFDAELRPKDGSGYTGYMERIAARAGTADGALPTCSVIDEVHELINPSQEDMYNRQRKGLLKREVPRRGGLFGGLLICISTQGDNAEKLLARLYAHGRRVAAGEVEDPSLLFLCWEAEKTPVENLDDPEQLDRALLAANPAAGHFLSLDQLRASYHDPTTERHDFERFTLNRLVTRPLAWISEDLWSSRADERGLPPDGTSIVLGFKGTHNRNSTGLVGWTPPGGEWGDYGFLVRVWDRDDGDPNWIVPHEEVEKEVAEAFRRWHVLEMVCQAPGWVTEVEAWQQRWGVRFVDAEDKITGTGPVLQFASHVNARFGPAVDRFRAAVLDPQSTLRHDGSAAVLRHVRNANARETPFGTRLVQDRKDSPRKIDLAEAAVMARERAFKQSLAVETRTPVMLGSLRLR